MFTDKIDITRDLGWYRESDSLTDVDLKFLVVYLEKHYGLSNEKRIEDVIKVVANENRYHPVLDRINSITWDGRERIRYALHHFLGAEVSSRPHAALVRQSSSVWNLSRFSAAKKDQQSFALP